VLGKIVEGRSKNNKQELKYFFYGTNKQMNVFHVFIDE